MFPSSHNMSHTYEHTGPLRDLCIVGVPYICMVTYIVDWAVVMVMLHI